MTAELGWYFAVVSTMFLVSKCIELGKARAKIEEQAKRIEDLEF